MTGPGSLRLEPWYAGHRLQATVLGPSWRLPCLLAMIIGGLGGIWPVGVLGAAGLGFCAGFVNGCVAAAAFSLLWLPPIAYLCLGADADMGVRAVQIAHGADPQALHRRTWKKLAGLTAIAIALGGCCGILGGELANVSAPAHFSVGLAGAVGAHQAGMALIAVVASGIISGSLAELSSDRRGCLVSAWGIQLLTLVLLSVLYFTPVLKPVQAASPWIGAWPLRSTSTMSKLFVVQLSYPVALTVTAVWILILRGALALRPHRERLPASAEHWA